MRRTLPSAPAPAPASGATTATILFQDQSFQVQTDLFSLASNKFRKAELGERKSIRIEEKVSIEAVRAFISACQGESCALTEETAHEVEFLAREWEAPAVLDAAGRLIEAKSAPLAVARLIFCAAHGLDSTAIESGMSEDLRTHLANPLLLEVPLPALRRIIGGHLGRCELSDDLFTFLKTALLRIGRPASILFESISFDQLNSRQMSELSHISEFDCHWLKGITGESLVAIASRQEMVDARFAEQDRRFNELAQQLAENQQTIRRQDGVIAACEGRIADLLAIIERLREEGTETHQEIQRQNEIFDGYERRITDVEERGVSRCTFSSYRGLPVFQLFFRCTTCGFADDEHCCEVCSRKCHKGHHLQLEKPPVVVTGHCDCGSHRSETCLCLPNP